MPILTQAQIISLMNAFIQANRPDLTTAQGSVIEDVVVTAPANQMAALYTEVQQTQEGQSLEFAAQMTTAQLDAFGANYGMTRLPAVAATGNITFRIQNFNFTSSTITINGGTQVSTVNTTTSPAVIFTTTTGVTFLPSLAPTYFNPATGFYEQIVPIVASVAGTIGNVGAGTITQLVTSIPGITAVINTTATTGGTNVESNTAFAQRIIIKLSGNNVGTPNGIISLVEATPGVVQAIIVGPNDPEMIRNQFGGSVDVYVRGQIQTSTFDTPVYTSAGVQQFILNHQPALAVASVTGIRGGNPFTFSPNHDYAFVENPNILFSGSTEAGSFINFALSTSFTITSVGGPTQLFVNTIAGMQVGSQITQGNASTTITALSTTPSPNISVVSTTGFVGGAASFTGLKPDNNTQLTITYIYDSLIESIQSVFNNDSNHIVASDILIKEALQALINITSGITIVPGFVGASVVSSVQTALTNYINGLGLGASIPLSEVVTVIQDVAGVSDVDLSTLTVSSVIGNVTTTIPPGQILSVPKTAYTVANILTITIE